MKQNGLRLPPKTRGLRKGRKGLRFPVAGAGLTARISGQAQLFQRGGQGTLEGGPGTKRFRGPFGETRPKCLRRLAACLELLSMIDGKYEGTSRVINNTSDFFIIILIIDNEKKNQCLKLKYFLTSLIGPQIISFLN